MSDRRIKVLLLIDEVMAPGGTENQLLALAGGLDPLKFEPVIGILRDSDYLDGINLPVPLVSFIFGELPVWRNIMAFLRIRRYLQKEKFDVVMLYFQEATIYGAFASRAIRPRPILVGTRRNLYHWVEEQPWLFRAVRWLNHWMDAIVANSFSVRDRCLQLEQISDQQVAVIPNGVDIRRFKGVDPVQAKTALGLDPGRPVVGVVGNWRPIKGLDCFLHAAVLVAKSFPSTQFVLAGRGEQKVELQNLANSLGLGGCTTFIENPKNLPSVISTFDVAVQPSLSESFSNVWLEYMAAGKPVVATRVGDAERIIDDGVEGILVPAGDSALLAGAIVSLIADPRVAARTGGAGREKVARLWSLGTMIARHAAFCEDIVKSRDGKSASSRSLREEK